jgi:hypothetical protein
MAGTRDLLTPLPELRDAVCVIGTAWATGAWEGSVTARGWGRSRFLKR